MTPSTPAALAGLYECVAADFELFKGVDLWHAMFGNSILC